MIDSQGITEERGHVVEDILEADHVEDGEDQHEQEPESPGRWRMR